MCFVLEMDDRLLELSEPLDETFLVGNLPIRMFWIESCEGFILRALSIDFDPLPL